MDEKDFNTKEVVWGIRDIQNILPHRYPFVMIDKIIVFEDNKRIVAVKNVTINEPFFPGHFPNRPVMPGVMLLEAMAQTGAILAIKSTDGVLPGKTVVLTGTDRAKWKKQIIPGDVIFLELSSIKKRRPIWQMHADAYVDGKIVGMADISAAEVD